MYLKQLTFSNFISCFTISKIWCLKNLHTDQNVVFHKSNCNVWFWFNKNRQRMKKIDREFRGQDIVMKDFPYLDLIEQHQRTHFYLLFCCCIYVLLGTKWRARNTEEFYLACSIQSLGYVHRQ